MSKYDDIINLPHYEPRHKRMSMEARAAQFAPFAALTGHGAAIAETARRTSAQSDMSADELQRLSQKIAYALSFADRPLISITYFQPDSRKQGGAYVTATGSIKKVEPVLDLLTLTGCNETGGAAGKPREIEIPLSAISDLTGEIFNDLEP